ncbi:hypothetical protein MBM09_10800 [Flaviramulus sp. BrNp1-15]|uniref:hypothetical protein n=1 Tax=Flaviramulus sp. BrNp1-15 TaxID=2916754 RepID=UPI001EE8D42D|nr:hypothetical protein [Flaviramulus sp. BrNp1-15]ULC58410.1 hypothetical protein MBM09_10800 [Flaviramulus sp. BrNp1-15]
MKLFLIILILTIPLQMFTQKQVPNSIKTEVKKALSYFPELKNTKIEFRFKKNIKKSTMQARPKFSSFFKKKRNRAYVILISKTFKISDKKFLTTQVPSDILTGWIGHELGHIIDYQNRSKLNLVQFGFKYLFSKKHITEAERAADTYAVEHGMEDYILKTKRFILNHADITPTYKARIKKFYLSPEEIMDIVNSRDAILETP